MTSGWRSLPGTLPHRSGTAASGAARIGLATARLAAALSLAVSALFLGPGALSAASSPHSTTKEIALGCDLLVAEGASGYFSVIASNDSGEADLLVWIAPADPIGAPTLVTSSSSVRVSADGGEIAATVELVRLDTGEPAGRADVIAVLTPVGDPQTSTRFLNFSNHKERALETIQPLAVSGTATLPAGQAMTLDGACSGASQTAELFQNDPASAVTQTDPLALTCEWSVGESVYVGLRGESSEGLSYLDVAVVTESGSFPGGTDTAVLTRTRIAGSFELSAAGQGLAATGGTAEAVADVSIGPRHQYIEGSGSILTRVALQEFTVTGTLTVSLDDGTAMSLVMGPENCQMVEYSVTSIDGGQS